MNSSSPSSPSWSMTTTTTSTTTTTTAGVPTSSPHPPLPFLTSWPTSEVGGGDNAVALAWWAWLVAEVGVATVIVAGDVSLLMLFFTRKLLGQSTNILVFSVAVGDLMTGLLVLPLDVLQRLLSETSGYMCKGYFYFSNVSKTAVIYTVTLLAAERIVAALSTSFRLLSPGRCLFFSSLTWFFAAAYNIWSVVLYDTRRVRSTAGPQPGSGQGIAEDGGRELKVPAAALASTSQRLAEELRRDVAAWSLRGGIVVTGIGGDDEGSGDGSGAGNATTTTAHVCFFSSARFRRLVEVFALLDFFVTFLVPVLASVVLFAVFWKRRGRLRAPGRPYRSSTSVLVFTFALLVSFVLCHAPLEVAALRVHGRDITSVARAGDGDDDFLLYKLCQLTSFTRGLWDVFIFGAFRHYVCRKERALAVFRGSRYSDRLDGDGAGGAGGGGEDAGDGEERDRGCGGPALGPGGAGGGVSRLGVGACPAGASLSVPGGGPPPSISLLDSDQEVTVTPHRSSISDQEGH